VDLGKVVGAVNYAQAIRGFGHSAAMLDPLGSAPPAIPCSNLRPTAITSEDLRALPANLISGRWRRVRAMALEAIQALAPRFIARRTG